MKKNKMLIAIDVGNTVVSIGLFRGNCLALKTSIPTRECKKKFGKELARFHPHLSPPPSSDGLRRVMRTPSERGRKRWGGNLSAIVASVVPGVDKVIKNILQKSGIRHRFVNPPDAGVSIRCREPKKVGVDRLLNTIAAHKIYKKGAIVVDCGTATTFDIVTPKGEYLGGAIAPGLKIGAEALAEKCAKLFPIKPDFPRFAIGKDTKEAMLSGVMLGHIAMIEGMIGRLERELKYIPVIIGTGGFIELIAKGTKVFDAIDPDLTLKGLMMITQIRAKK